MTASARVQLVSFLCTDHESLAGFYRDAFGFEVIPEVGSPIFTALDAGGVALGFHAEDAYDLLGIGDRRNVLGPTHVTIDLGTVDAVEASVERLTDLGASVVQGPFTTYYDARQVVFLDPERNVLRVSDTQPALS